MTTIHHTVFETPVGSMQAASLHGALLACRFPDGADLGAWLLSVEPGAAIERDSEANGMWIEQIQAFLRGTRTTLDGDRLDMRGTPFQVRVWEELRRIPYGETITYSELAKRVESPRAVRAVGQANGANPLPLFVPCHRVVASGGELGGFGGGRRLKRRLLDLETRGGTLFPGV